jgi:hypothetical protein
MSTTSIIIAERKNGSGFAKSAYICADEADFISRIQALADSKGISENILTVSDACGYLNECYAQQTMIITRADFDALTPDSWDTAVLKQAERLGWYEEPAEGEVGE